MRHCRLQGQALLITRLAHQVGLGRLIEAVAGCSPRFRVLVVEPMPR